MGPTSRQLWFFIGLFTMTLATLSLEVLNTRLLSVLTWYHLSFFAVSVAMFGMSAGAVHVYLGGKRFEEVRAVQMLAHVGMLFTLSIPLCHILNLSVPLRLDLSLTAVAAAAISTLALAIPFYLAGILVSIALTRVPGRIGLVYAVDLIGAALGCLAVIPLLHWANISSATFAVGGLAGLGTLCFRKFAGVTGHLPLAAMTAGLFVIATVNGLTPHGFRVLFPKGHAVATSRVVFEAWNTYSQVIALGLRRGQPFYWGAGRGASGEQVETVHMRIDGSAGTAMTRWDGEPSSLGWVRFDVTSLPYHLRPGGDTAVIGVGGGRDILTAVWAHARSVTGIEINQAFVHLLRGPYRKFARIADRPDVELIHDEARSYLTRTPRRFDILQMSLIDTWAATGAGAFSLSENGLYTVEAWRVFLGVLKPGGVFSTSRWFAPGFVFETGRLMALASSALFDRGITDLPQHLILVSRGRVATLLVSTAPFTEADIVRLAEVAMTYDFTIHVAPGRQPVDEQLRAILASTSRAELDRATQDARYDFSPPTDERPYFFNMLKPTGLLRFGLESNPGVALRGNLLATATLALLAAIAAFLVAAIIVAPLIRSGRPAMAGRSFLQALLYFALIGFGYMMVQIPLVQRFSVYLGHPTYAIAIILFSMILFTGIGSLISDRVPVHSRPGWLLAIPLTIALSLAAITLSIQRIVESTIQFGLLPRSLIVVGLVAPLSMLLGFCFPLGMRLVGRLNTGATAWMWGVNGACGVLSSVFAIAVSIWAGIHTSLYLAVVCYAVLVLPARALWRYGNWDMQGIRDAGWATAASGGSRGPVSAPPAGA